MVRKIQNEIQSDKIESKNKDDGQRIKAEIERDFLIEWIGEQIGDDGDRHLVEMALRGDEMGSEIASVKKLRDAIQDLQKKQQHRQAIDVKPPQTIDAVWDAYINHVHEYEQPDGVGITKKPADGMKTDDDWFDKWRQAVTAKNLLHEIALGNPTRGGWWDVNGEDKALIEQAKLSVQRMAEKTSTLESSIKQRDVQLDEIEKIVGMASTDLQPNSLVDKLKALLADRKFPCKECQYGRDGEGQMNGCLSCDFYKRGLKAKALDEIVRIIFNRNRSYEEHNSDRYEEIVAIASPFK